jgi:hypothetical protein
MATTKGLLSDDAHFQDEQDAGGGTTRNARPWFLNVPGNQFLVDHLKLTLIIIVPLFLALVTLLVIFPTVFEGSMRKRKRRSFEDGAPAQRQRVDIDTLKATQNALWEQ